MKTCYGRKTFVGILLLLSSFVFSQPASTVNGKVTNKAGDPVAGATINVKGTNIASTSDANGNYRITAPPKSKTLVISYVGMEEKEVSIAGQTAINVSLDFARSMLSEVVVVG